jgi:hypothetical protein
LNHAIENIHFGHGRAFKRFDDIPGAKLAELRPKRAGDRRQFRETTQRDQAAGGTALGAQQLRLQALPSSSARPSAAAAGLIAFQLGA